MPRWVPVLIGAMLVAMAALAVYTGLRYRDDEHDPRSRCARSTSAAMTPAPPGEPGAGASLVVHGEEGENTPAANEPVQGQSRAVVTRRAGRRRAVVRIWARRGMVLDVLPADTMVYVAIRWIDDRWIGSMDGTNK